MKDLKTILLGAGLLAMMACNDATTDADNDKDSLNENRTDTSTTATGTALAEKDAQFLSEVAASNMAEIKLSQLAQQKGTNQGVKDIAKMLETDHSAVLGEVRSFASGRSVSLPAEEKEDARDMHNKLNAKTGREFDKDWCEHMVDMHQKSIKKFEDAQNDLNDADLKAWVGNTLPKLRTHLDKLKECDKKLK